MHHAFSVFILSFVCLFLNQSFAQSDPPKLVVVIAVDQMRAEYLVRYADKFGDNGFKKLMNQGYHFRNAHYTFIPTETGPGHAAIYSGALPSVSGIIGNDWYDRKTGKSVNVVSGITKYKTIGATDTSFIGQAGPDRLLVTTIADELKKSSQFRSKTISVSIKDRSAIMGGGHTADGSFWYDGLTGNFVSSSYYMDSLPSWVSDFNQNGFVDSVSRKVWELSYPLEEYTESREDNNPYEYRVRGREAPVFPYDMGKLNEGFNSYFLIPYSPFSNDILVDFAKAAVRNEKMGSDDNTDFLAIGFSNTDYSGHAFGPYSVEIEDLYIKMDETIARLIEFLDQSVGKNEYIMVLTSDHGAVAAPRYLRSKKLPGGLSNINALAFLAETHIKSKYGIDSVIEYSSKLSFYLNRDKLSDDKLFQEVSMDLKRLFEKNETIQSAFTRDGLQSFGGDLPDFVKLLQNGFFPERSGDIFFISRPGWLGLSPRIATGHGAPFSYDTHVPIIFYGKNIPSGSSVRKVAVTHIAPSLSFLCDVMIPSGSTGEVLLELFD